MGINDLPYRHAIGDGGPRSQTQCVVIHATDNTASDTDEAGYATWRPDHTSAHFYVDGDSAVRSLPLGNIAYGCHPIGNSRSVQFELCGRSNAISDATMRQAAPLVAEVCRLYSIPVRHIGPSDLAAGARGIAGHADVTAAWRQGDHTDPGPGFDWVRFIGYVAAVSGANPPPPAAGTPFPLKSGEVFGDVAGPAWMHGGFFQSERGYVGAIQRRLQALGFAPNYPGWADGKYERPTTDSVRAFQHSRRLAEDGLVGPITWRALGL